jgi:hypothetical protein
MALARFAFQACSFDHSNISPYLESTTCEQSETVWRKTLHRIPMFLDAIWIQRFTDVRERIVVGIV